MHQTWKDIKTRCVHCQIQNGHSEFPKERRRNPHVPWLKLHFSVSIPSPRVINYRNQLLLIHKPMTICANQVLSLNHVKPIDLPNPKFIA